jgi:DNA invertase Pin-like site-specific DNA recombinase
MALNDFKKYSKYKEKQDLNNVVWSYTRVSSKEQYENNSSLRNQKEKARIYSEENGYLIANEFGGTYESAKR